MYKNHIKYFAQINKDILFQITTELYKVEGYKNKEVWGVWNRKSCELCSNYHSELCETCTSKKYIPCEPGTPGAIKIKDEKFEIVSKMEIKCKKNTFNALKRNSILAFLYYHFMNVNTSTGIINAVYVPDMAKTLNVTYNTIVNTNKTLEELGLISVNKIGRGLISVQLNRYNQYYSEEKIKRVDINGNTVERYNGVIKLTRELFFSLINKTKTSNELRLALYKVLKYDNNRVRNKHENYTIAIVYNEFKDKLQGKLCNKEVASLLSNVKSIFDDSSINYEEQAVNEFRIKSEYNITKKLKSLKNHANKKVFSLFKSLTEKQKGDLNALCNEFDADNILKVINMLIDKRGETIDSIKDRIGLIRIEIKNAITTRLASYTYSGVDIFESKEAFTF